MAYFMRKNAENRIPLHHVCVDTETYPTSPEGNPCLHLHKLMLGCATSWRLRGGGAGSKADLDFHTREQWWRWLDSRAARGQRVCVWAHNAPFDFTVLGLWDELDSGRLRLRRPPGFVPRKPGTTRPDGSAGCTAITSPFCFALDCISSGGKSYRFVDSTNFAPLKLEGLGAMLGLEKLPMPSEVASEEDWRAYCRRDVEILALVVKRLLRFVKEKDLGNMQLTLGGQSLSHFRHRHLDHDIIVGPEPTIRPMEREGYYGARACVYFRGVCVQEGTEDFSVLHGCKLGGNRISVSPIHRVDCNSCYPFVMRDNRFPIRLFRRLYAPSLRDLKACLVNGVAVASVRLHSPEEPYPVRVDNRVVWMVGTIHTVLCGPELERALASNHVVSVAEVQVYHAAPIFTSWATEVLSWKAAAQVSGDEFEAALVKRMANSLHGKFGQTGRNWDSVAKEVPPMPWGEYAETDERAGTVKRCRAVAGVKQVWGTEPESSSSMPAIAAWVCAYAREHVRAARRAAGVGHCLYEDADSLHVDAAGYAALELAGWIHPHRPGAFKLEETAETAEYVGPKHYRLGDKWVIPGHALSGAYDAKGVWHQTEWIGLDALLSRGKPDAPITVERELTEPRPSGTETYGQDGWIVFRRGGA